MMNPFGCATFHHQDYEDDELCLANPNSKPKKKDHKDTNPYSTRGLDKFSQLLADLDEKRQKIYSQMSPHDISFVRFAYSSTDDFVPIVVKKVKNNNTNNKDKKNNKSQELKVVKATKSFSSTIDQSSSEIVVEEIRNQPKLGNDDANVATNEKKRSLLSWNVVMKNFDMWRPCFYVPMVIVLILVMLALFGRSITTLCTCVLWYAFPTLKDMSSSSSSSSNSSRKSMKKKEYVSGLSEKKMVVINERVMKKKDYARGFSEKKIVVVSEGLKKKDYVRGWSEKKISTDGLLSSPRKSDGDFADSKNKSSGKHGHKNSW